MGRKRIYFTEDERKEAQRRWQLEYYYRNRERLKLEKDIEKRIIK